MAVVARPDRDLVPPPELAGDAPVGRLLERLDREPVLALRVEPDTSLTQRLDRGAAELVHPAPPLRGDERLDAGVASLAGPHRMAVRVAALEPAALLEPREDPLVRLLLREPLEALGDHPPVGPDHRQRGELVVAADLEVHRVVPRRDLDRARAELRVDAVVRDDGHSPLDHGHDHLAADGVRVTRVVGMDRHGRVGEERRGPHRRDREPAAALGERVDDPVEHVVLLDVLDLEVGDRRLVVRAPVDDPVRPVDPAALPETYEERHHGADVLVVHGEPLARVVDRRAEPPVLAHDRPARPLEPVPGPRDERLAADLAARGALRDELLLDDVLRRDAGVVVPRLPERVEPLHPVPADQDVLHRAVQRVPHVELARDVRRRDADHEGVVPAAARAGGVEALRLPGLLPAPLDARGVVQRIHGEGV